jgi:hypothetical protein
MLAALVAGILRLVLALLFALLIIKLLRSILSFSGHFNSPWKRENKQDFVIEW